MAEVLTAAEDFNLYVTVTVIVRVKGKKKR
jgi:hypothetical protein